MTRDATSASSGCTMNVTSNDFRTDTTISPNSGSGVAKMARGRFLPCDCTPRKWKRTSRDQALICRASPPGTADDSTQAATTATVGSHPMTAVKTSAKRIADLARHVGRELQALDELIEPQRERRKEQDSYFFHCLLPSGLRQAQDRVGKTCCFIDTGRTLKSSFVIDHFPIQSVERQEPSVLHGKCCTLLQPELRRNHDRTDPVEHPVDDHECRRFTLQRSHGLVVGLGREHGEGKPFQGLLDHPTKTSSVCQNHDDTVNHDTPSIYFLARG
ncbi:MAG: hypothetical protein UT32_C0008G0022 [Parcubacteria group bacterium GW2011_GWC2_39_14]|nr:MAG: hypothetical protein UT32_C0008G0022 [Parcubacteria group bacterium GW2011_GWC2_39_14]KKR54913.1 MAG: hypothetical protein UT91_C0007G0014 [Parcubacteria group bacterium GW2011_GWA2_40_23]